MLVQFVHQSCMWAGVRCEMEVFNLFSGVVRQEGLSRMEKAKQRQSLVPDLRIDVPPLGIAVLIVIPKHENTVLQNDAFLGFSNIPSL